VKNSRIIELHNTHHYVFIDKHWSFEKRASSCLMNALCTRRIVPYTVHQLSFGVIKENNVPGLYDGPFSWENMFGFHLAGMVGHDFFKSYAVTFDFENMQISIRYRGRSLSCMP